MKGCGLDLTDTGSGTLTGSHEQDSESSGFFRGGDFLTS
jgi:hypothetical protein